MHNTNRRGHTGGMFSINCKINFCIFDGFEISQLQIRKITDSFYFVFLNIFKIKQKFHDYLLSIKTLDISPEIHAVYLQNVLKYNHAKAKFGAHCDNKNYVYE